MQNETIDKLKNAGYITVTDDSQGIADKAGIPSGGSDIPLEYSCPDDFSVTIQPEDWEYDKEISIANFDTDISVEFDNGDIALIYGECNGVSGYGSDMNVVIEVPWGDARVNIYIDKSGYISGSISAGIFDPSELVAITLNFTNLLFISNIKRT